MRRDADSLPRWSIGGVRVDSGDAQEEVGLTDAEVLGWVGGASGGLSHDHSASEPLHDVNKLLSSAGGRAAGQDEQALLGAISCA